MFSAFSSLLARLVAEHLHDGTTDASLVEVCSKDKHNQ